MGHEHISVATRVANQIRDMIYITHELNKGDKLSNERELAAKLGASRNSLREAIKILVSEGLIVTKHGSGNYITGKSQEGAITFGSNIHDKTIMKNWYEMRLIVEPDIARLGVERASEEEVKEIVRWADEIRHVSTVSEFVFADQQFHASVAVAAHNDSLLRLVPHIQAASYYGSALAIAGNWFVKAKEQSIRYHGEIARAFQLRNAFQAYLTMQNHLMQGMADIEW